MRICLTVSRARGAPPSSPHRFTFEQDEVLIGRDPAVEVRLPDPAVSLVHLRLVAEKGRLFAVDPGSTNGTRLGDRRLSPQVPVEVRPGARLTLGPFVLELEEPQGRELTRAEDTTGLARRMVLEVLGALGGGHPSLAVEGGPEDGRRVEIPPGATLVVGRGDDCALRLEDVDASRHHLEVQRQGTQVVARDLGSKNGLELNGERVQDHRALRHGDILRVGATLLRFSDPADQYLDELSRAVAVPSEPAPASEPPGEAQASADPEAAPVNATLAAPVSPSTASLPATRRAGLGLQLLLLGAGLVLAASVAALVYMLI